MDSQPILQQGEEGRMVSGADAEDSPVDSSKGKAIHRASRLWIRIAALVVVGAVIVSALAVSLRPPNAAPTITAATVSTESTNVSQTLFVSGSATDPDRDVLTFTWNFGDNSTGTGANIPHAYSIPGRYVILLTVTDGRGGEATNDAALLFVVVRPRLSDAAPPSGPPSGACASSCTVGPGVAILAANQTTAAIGDLVRFTANASWAYTWNWNNASNRSEGGAATPVSAADNASLFTTLTYGWGDGSATTGGSSESVGATSHRYTRPGNFFVRLTLTLPTVAGTVSTFAGYTIRVTAATPPLAMKHPSTITKVTFGEPDSLDPAVNAETSGGEILQNVYETLLWYESGTENVTALVPRLAIDVPTEANRGVSEDGRNYTFTLRTDVTFHSGALMTPDDVVYSIQRVLGVHDPNGPSWILEQVLTNFVARYVKNVCGPGGDAPCTLADYADRSFPSRAAIPTNILTVLEGVAPEANWSLHALNRSVAWAVSNSTVKQVETDKVVFHLTRPYPAFLQAMASTVGSIVEKACASTRDGWETRNVFLDRQGDCGTGPYKLGAWVPNVVVVLTRFDGYWQGAAPMREVHIEKVNGVFAREFMLLSGDADVATITRDRQLDLATVDGTPKYTTLRIAPPRPTFDVTVFGYNQAINVSASPALPSVPWNFFANISVRKAFSYAFDYNAFLRNVTYDTGVQLRGPIAQGIPGHNMSTPVFPYDLAKAAEELNMTPYGRTGFNITLYYNAGNSERKEGCLLLRKGLEALSTQNRTGPISVTVQGIDWPAYLRAFRANGLPIFFLGWRPDYADPDDYVLPFLRSGGVFASRVGFANATMDGLIDAATAELNQSKRMGMYQALSSIAVWDHVPYLWVYQSLSFHVERTWVRGYYFNPMLSGLDYYWLWKVAS
jgi:peptide/nickel transport system substrate-binding protein